MSRKKEAKLLAGFVEYLQGVLGSEGKGEEPLGGVQPMHVLGIPLFTATAEDDLANAADTLSQFGSMPRLDAIDYDAVPQLTDRSDYLVAPPPFDDDENALMGLLGR